MTCNGFSEYLKCLLDTIIECETKADALAKANTVLAKPIATQQLDKKAARALTPNASPDQRTGNSMLPSVQNGFLKYNRPSCAHCGDKHPLIKCKLFRTSTFEARSRTVRQNRLCENCLLYGLGHGTNDCDEGPCHRCKIKHNSIMCREFRDKDHSKQ